MNNTTIMFLAFVGIGVYIVTLSYVYALSEREVKVSEKLNQACESQLIYYEKLLDDNNIQYRG